MSTPVTPDFRVVSPKRRMMLAGLSAGLCGAIFAALRWPASPGQDPKDQVRPLQAKAPGKTSPIEISADETAGVETINPSPWSREWFSPHVRSDFQVADHGSLRLIEVSPASELHNGAVAYTSFTLLFEGPADPVTPEGIHRLSHGVLGEMDLFLTPVGRPTTRTCYEAAFTLKS
jgi:hypothetical protein